MMPNVLQDPVALAGVLRAGDVVVNVNPPQQEDGAELLLFGMRVGALNVLIANPRFSGLRITIGAGMAVHQAVADKWLALTGCPIVEAYGLTETSPAATCNPILIREWSGTIGLPFPSTEIAILDDAGQPVPLGQPGEIAIRGPQVMAGYWQRPDETAKVMTPDGFFKSGDIGIMDERGHTRIVDRKKDMIIVSGFNVFPNALREPAAPLSTPSPSARAAPPTDA